MAHGRPKRGAAGCEKSNCVAWLNTTLFPHRLGGQITPLLLRDEIALASYPRDSSTSWVCSPSTGGGWSILGGVRLRSTAFPTIFTFPIFGCSTSFGKP